MTIRESIFKAKDLKQKSLEVKEWGVTLQIRGLTARERADYLDFINKKKGKDGDIENIHGLCEKIIVMGVVDPSGKNVFSEENDMEELSGKNADVLQRISEEILQLSGIDAESVAKAKRNLA